MVKKLLLIGLFVVVLVALKVHEELSAAVPPKPAPTEKCQVISVTKGALPDGRPCAILHFNDGGEQPLCQP